MIDSPSGRVPEKASRWDLVVLKIVAAEKVFRGLSRRFYDSRVFIEAELGQMEACGPHYVPRRALVPSGPLLRLLIPSRSFQGLLSPEEISKTFHGIWTSFGIDILQSKNKQLALGTKLIG